MRYVVPVIVSLSLVGTADLTAQVRASERATVSQTVDGTTITMDYSRPQVRGRNPLFGGLVPWGSIWTGANWATTISADRNITLDGQPVPAGKYSVWFEVQPETWTLILDPVVERIHFMPPPRADNQIRLPVRTETGPYTELLTWSFPEVRHTGTTLRFAWGTTAVSLAVGVEPSQRYEVAADFAERFTGTWQITTQGALGNGTQRFEVSHRNDRLTVRWENPPDPRLGTLWLVPRGAGIFAPVEVENDQPWDVSPDVVIEFTPLEGRATKFEVRGIGDELWGTGIRR
ncbi:MAG TPA: DUF2911 domain-containing protein [Gemmatimonadales bacterium]|nr:DUF2911 domain-containing protein [Gemmatimonadales bacterium]